MSTLRELLARARAALAGEVDDPLLDAQVLLAHVLGRDRSWLYAWPEHAPSTAQAAAFEALLQARLNGAPVAHLTGEREFWSIALQVTPQTLIPRPETEQLVEIALARDLPAGARILDLGTGSGAIALVVARERPDWDVTAVDRSPEALAVARGNADRLHLDNVRFLRSDWFADLPGGPGYDLILGNPPYIAADDPHLSIGDVRFEPAGALVAGNDGLEDLFHLIDTAPRHLAAGGSLWLEHGCQQGPAVAQRLQQRGFVAIATHQDFAGHPRHSGGYWPMAAVDEDPPRPTTG